MKKKTNPAHINDKKKNNIALENAELRRKLKESEEKLNSIIGSQNDAILIYDLELNAVQANPSFIKTYGFNPAGLNLKDIIKKVNCRRLDGKPLKPDEQPAPQALRGKKVKSAVILVSKADGSEAVVESSTGPLRKGKLLTGSVTIWHDITGQMKAREEFHKTNRTLKALSRSSQAIMRAADEMSYMKDVCRIIVEDCGHAMVWIGFSGNDEDKTVRPVAYAGFEKGYLETLHITWADTERGRGPTGTAIRTGNICMCRNMLTDPEFEPWREEAIKRGYASSIVLPLFENKKTFGAINIYSRDPDPFSADEVSLLSELAGDLSYGIMTIRLREAHANAEEALMQSEEKFRLIAMNTPDHILIQDADLRYTMVINPQLGLTEKNMIGKTDFEILSKEDAINLTKIKERVLETGNPESINIPLVNDKGEAEYFEGSYVPKRNPLGRIDGILGYFRNLTERKKMEEALRENEKRYRSLFNSMTEGFALHEIVCDGQGIPCDYRFLEINPAFERLTGLNRRNVTGRRLSEVMPDEDPKWVEIYGNVALTGNPVHFENYSPVLKKHLEVYSYRPSRDNSRRFS